MGLKHRLGFLSLFFLSAVAGAQAPGESAGDPDGVAGPATSVLSGFMEPFPYDPQGRKDPFAQPTIEKPLPPGAFHGPVLPLQRFSLDPNQPDSKKLRLIGIIWDVSKPRAMIMDPNSRVHVVGPNAKIGDRNGYVAAIREGEIVVIETYEEDGKLFSSARVVKIASADETVAR